MESKYTNKYEVACAILEKLSGGSGGGKFVLADGTKLSKSTFTEIPNYYDFSEITNFAQMFASCRQLTTVVNLDMSNGTDFTYAFEYCYGLTTVGNLDMSNGSTFSGLFDSCNKLTTVRNLKTTNGSVFEYMFRYCSKLTTVGNLDTSNGSNFSSQFESCIALTSVQSLDLSNGTNLSRMFSGCGSLENISFVGSINYSIDFSNSTLLTYDSIKSILTACSATTRTGAKTLKFNRTIADNNGELVTLIGECTTKGWTITGLTLE